MSFPLPKRRLVAEFTYASPTPNMKTFFSSKLMGGTSRKITIATLLENLPCPDIISNAIPTWATGKIGNAGPGFI